MKSEGEDIDFGDMGEKNPRDPCQQAHPSLVTHPGNPASEKRQGFGMHNHCKADNCGIDQEQQAPLW